ncbi:hypothetical protein EV424DRAFT_1373398 [Suillus variegatus]|nr:hypothetical protein EV424DRAFT_1373398 [Suillus variegatus]
MMCTNFLPPHRLDLKQNCICTIQRNLSMEKGLLSAKRARTRNCTASQIRPSPTTQYIRRPLHSAHQLCFPSKSFIVDSRSKTVSSATRICNHINGCQGLTLARTVLDL